MKIAALLTALTLAVASTPALSEGRGPRIEVTGIGEAKLAPDMAHVTLSVTREGKSARAALDENNAAMAAVLAAMREEGIADRDLQTSGFNIQPQMVYPDQNNRDESPRIVGYTVTNSLTVRVRDLARLGAILDLAVDLGVNRDGGISFTHSDPSQAIEDARTAAVKDALRRARTLAEAAGGRLGEVISITEHAPSSGPRPMMRLEAAAAPYADAVPLAAGENSYNVLVTGVFRYEGGKEEGSRD